MKKSFPFIVQRYDHDIVTLPQAREWLRMDIPGYDGEDNSIVMAIQSAVSRVESTCNLSLGISTYEWNVDCRPCDFEDVFYVQEIVGISYYDTDNYTPIDTTKYRLKRLGTLRSEIKWIDYPVDREIDDYKITFKAGMPEGTVPGDLLLAIRSMIVQQFDTRGDIVAEKKTLSDKLMENYRIGYVC